MHPTTVLVDKFVNSSHLRTIRNVFPLNGLASKHLDPLPLGSPLSRNADSPLAGGDCLLPFRCPEILSDTQNSPNDSVGTLSVPSPGVRTFVRVDSSEP